MNDAEQALLDYWARLVDEGIAPAGEDELLPVAQRAELARLAALAIVSRPPFAEQEYA